MKFIQIMLIATASITASGFQSSQLNIRPSTTKLLKLSSSAKLELIRKAGAKLQSTTPKASFWLSPASPKSASPKGFLTYHATFEPDPIYNGFLYLNDIPQHYSIKVMRPTDTPEGVPLTYLITLHIDSTTTSDVRVNTGESSEWQHYYFYGTGPRQHTIVVSSTQPQIYVSEGARHRDWMKFYGADIEIYR